MRVHVHVGTPRLRLARGLAVSVPLLLVAPLGCPMRQIAGTDVDGGDGGPNACVSAGGNCVSGPEVQCQGEVLTTYDCSQTLGARAICCLMIGAPDGGADGGGDAGSDAGIDAGPDGGGDAGSDAGLDAGLDAGPDAGMDGGGDAGGSFCVMNDGGGVCIPGMASDLSPVMTSASASFDSLASADLNGDGLLDLVAGLFAPNSLEQGGFEVFLARSDGGLSPAVSYPATSGSTLVFAIGDINGDGFPDVVVGDYLDINVFANDGGGGLSLWTVLPMSGSAAQIGIGDLDGDGIADIAVLAGESSQVIVLHGEGSGMFSAASVIPGVGGILAVADLNQDCLADIVTGSTGGGLAILLSQGDGGFAESLYPVSVSLSSNVALMPNLPGAPDLVLEGSSGIQVLRNDGKGSFSDGPSSSAVEGPSYDSLFVGDFNGDCIPDVIVAQSLPDCGTATEKLLVLYGEGDGGLSEPLSLVVGGPPAAIAGLGLVDRPGALASAGGYCGNGIVVYGDPGSQ